MASLLARSCPAGLGFGVSLRATALPITSAARLALVAPRVAPISAIFGLGTKKAVASPAKSSPSRRMDSIFGTSGGFGFTKENELFVGRVAMLGFAASLLGEAVTGQGILAQLNLETGIPIYEAEPLLLSSSHSRCSARSAGWATADDSSTSPSVRP